MDEFELEDNLEFLLQSIQELIEDQGEGNPFVEASQNELLASLVNYDQENTQPDVSVADVVNGMDMQGIPWEKMLFPRDHYREIKLRNYRNYQNLSYTREDALQECKQVENDSPYYAFQYSTRRAQPSIVHFQGELICKRLEDDGVVFSTRVTDDENAITNSLEIYQDPNGSRRLVAANNDCSVRIFDTEYFDLVKHCVFPWSVNCVSVSPNGKLFAVLGDHEDGLVVDPKCGKAIGSLRGHLDYSFASAWHPDGNILATGSQDTTCRLWDIRNLSQSLAVLGGRMGSIRCIKFSSDGRFLATSEPMDFVHIYDSYADYGKSHEMDFFGEIAGLSFSPDTESFYVGIADQTYGGLIEFNRRHQHHYVNCLW